MKLIDLESKFKILQFFSIRLGIINMKVLQRARKEEEVLAAYERTELGYINRENSCLNESAYIIDFIMSKRKSDAKQPCDMHTFRLEPKLSDCYYQDTIKAKFCGYCDKTGTSSIKKSYEGPIFNKDKVATSPAFILKSEKDKFKLSASLMDNENEQKYFQVNQQKSEMLVPKPSSKSFYCNVCKQKYQDYLEHIQTVRHRNKIQNNPFNKHIINLSSKYEKQRNIKDSKEKQKSNQNLSTETENIIIIDQDSVEEIDQARPRKRVKLDQTRGVSYPQACQQSMQNFYRYQHQALLAEYIRNYSQYMNPMNAMNPMNHMMNYPCYPPMMPMMNMPQAHHRYFQNMNKFYSQMHMPMMPPGYSTGPVRRTDNPPVPGVNMEVILIQD